MFSLTSTFSRTTGPSLQSFISRRMFGLAVIATIVVTALPLATSAHEFKAGDLELKHPWSRETPSGAKVAGGYIVIKNTGSTPDRLISANADISEHAEIHEMAVKDGVMTMRPLSDGLQIPAGGEIVLKPGSYHLMFIGLKQPTKKGESFPGTLTFEKAGKVEVTFSVEAMGEAGEGHKAGH